MLDGLFRPRSIAVIGASANPFSIGYIVINNLLKYGFKGPVFPVNPKGGQIQCLKAYKSITDVPDEVDLCNIVVAAKFVPGIVEECGKKGVKFCIVHSAGFKEVGPEGLKREQEMVAIAHKYGMRIFGPNSQGAQNADPEIASYANFTFTPQLPGNVSVMAQGGGMGEMLKLHLYRAGLGHRLYCSYGNESDLTMPEILEYYGQDPGTKVIMMQTESFKDPAAFVRVAAQITPRKAILAIKAGRTREGSQAVASHTGSLVDQVAMAKAMYRKAGVLQFHDTDDMIRTAIALSSQEPPPGRRIGMITNTGGPGIQAVDEAVDKGLTLATWSEAGRQRLKESLYAEASLGNPVDVVATANADHYFAAVDTLLKEEGVDMVHIFFVTALFADGGAIARRLKEAIGASKKPTVVTILTFEKFQGLVDELRAAGIPVFEFAEHGSRALAAMARYGEIQRRRWDAPPELAVDRARVEKLLQPHLGKGTYLSQADAFEVLAAYGIPAPKLRRVTSAADLDAAAAAAGFPCVLKVDSADVVHKSDEGGVALGIADRKALGAAFDAMRDKFTGRAATFVVQEQRAKGRELIVGVKACPGLGSLVMFGLGGIFVEVMRDVSFALAPFGRAEARELMRDIKGYPVLEGVRGEAPADVPALEDLLCRVARLAADFPAIAEMDLNPIFAYPTGTAPCAVDVRIRVS
jgi:acetate---CoA ligase (ADP-forming)